MALIHCDFFSEVLDISTAMYVILPQPTQGQIGLKGRSFGTKHPVLYLLHGLSDDHTIWLRRTSIERYVAPLGLAVVMPAVNRSFYTDMERGYRYWTFISQELPEIARSFFPLSGEREENFVAGLSMGGYGAFKLALRHPEKFAAAASLSGALDIVSRVRDEARQPEFENIFGDPQKLIGSDNDLFHLAQKVAKSTGPKPLLYQCCGTEDFLYPDNIRFRDFFRRLPLALTYEEEPGTHEWGYWDRKIQRVLEWLPLRKDSQPVTGHP
ncbi:S-formylglutathione hydrolase FrmB [Hydrogenispora ethanolica]|jgi:S-formylglutathione hydrolase FrmB|uniref:S-formylglutathione hydrolase FrmB n=1 Tax=Hydrogenispora ethanolica TaxID=1082276 RepID=A0A4R1R783_HYDET|nr:alpha/beta hydrolase family protein [Hydrogenispora ethanolica]TCL61466.1 S-formylglutathione hydrolase FrmB [Hydrogenispora ethanolica]